MKFAFISPINYLHLIPDYCDFHLILAHLLTNKTYVNFYKQRQKQGDFLLLDNSAFEFKRPIELEEILSLIEQSGLYPDMLVAPDYPFEKGIKTIKSTEATKERLNKLGLSYKLMSVPQSEKGNYEDWFMCLKELISLESDFIGMSILGCPNAFCNELQTDDIMINRIYASLYIKHNCDIWKKTKFHYLGLGQPREIQYQKMIGLAYSNDSSSPFWHGINQIKYDISYGGLENGKLELPVDFNVAFCAETVDLIRYNIYYIEQLLK